MSAIVNWSKPTQMCSVSISQTPSHWFNHPSALFTTVYMMSICAPTSSADCTMSAKERSEGSSPLVRLLQRTNNRDSQTSAIWITLGVVLLLCLLSFVIWRILRKIKKTAVAADTEHSITKSPKKNNAAVKFNANNVFEKALSEGVSQPRETSNKPTVTIPNHFVEPTEILSHEFVRLNPSIAKTASDMGQEVKDLTSSQFNLVEGVNLRQNACDFEDWGMGETGDLGQLPTKLNKKKLFPSKEKKGDSKSERQPTVPRIEGLAAIRLEPIRWAYVDHS